MERLPVLSNHDSINCPSRVSFRRAVTQSVRAGVELLEGWTNGVPPAWVELIDEWAKGLSPTLVELLEEWAKRLSPLRVELSEEWAKRLSPLRLELSEEWARTLSDDKAILLKPDSLLGTEVRFEVWNSKLEFLPLRLVEGADISGWRLGEVEEEFFSEIFLEFTFSLFGKIWVFPDIFVNLGVFKPKIDSILLKLVEKADVSDWGLGEVKKESSCTPFSELMFSLFCKIWGVSEITMNWVFAGLGLGVEVAKEEQGRTTLLLDWDATSVGREVGGFIGEEPLQISRDDGGRGFDWWRYNLLETLLLRAAFSGNWKLE